MEESKRKAASRKNAKLGGVKTDAGKAISKMNALKHGVLAHSNTTFDPVSAQEIYELLAEEFGLGTPSRQILVGQLTLTVLRLARCARAEAEIIREDLIHTASAGPTLEGDSATLSKDSLESLGLIYERYEPRLVSRLLRLLETLKEKNPGSHEVKSKNHG